MVCHAALCPLQGKRREQLREVFQSAHDAGLQALQGEVAAAAEGVSDSVAWGQLLDALEPIQVGGGTLSLLVWPLSFSP